MRGAEAMKKWLILGAANFSGALLSLLRNVVIARLLAPEEFGIASTFAITLALFEVLSNIGINNLIVQARDGNRARLQADLQGIQLARGVIAGALLLVLAGPYARLLGAGEALWAYQVMAGVPLLRGLWHLDIFRLQREMRFLPFAAATVVSQVLAVAAVWPLAEIGRDYTIMLWTILFQQASFTLVSHLMATRRYRIRWSGAIVRKAMRFGLPLLGNGILLFGIFHGDRLIIANQAGLDVLGWFAVAAMLTLTPSMVLAKTLQPLFLPRLARMQDDAAGFARTSAQTIEAFVLAGTALALGFALVGEPLLIALFGIEYAAALNVLTWLAVMQAVRLFKAGPTIVAISLAETTNPLIANFTRCLALPASFAALAAGAPVVVVAWTALAGEALAVLVSLALLRVRLRLGLGGMVWPIAAGAGMLATIGLDTELVPPTLAILPDFYWGQAGLIACFCLLTIAMPTVRARLFGCLAGWPQPDNDGGKDE